jgi:multiple sugar transport system substrate-binding protein
MMPTARRRIGSALSLACVVGVMPLVASACGGSAGTGSQVATTGKTVSAASTSRTFEPVPSNQKVTLTMVTYLPLISAGAQTTLNKLISGFEAAYPNIKVKIQASATPTGGAILSTVEQDEAAGSPPDVVQSVMDGLRYLALGGTGAQPLEGIVGEKAVQEELGGDHPYPTAVAALGLIEAHQYGIPWVLSTPVLFYNADLFKRAGLDPAKPPTTWAQVEADARTVKKTTGADGVANCAVGAATANVDWCTQAVIKSAGGTVLSPNAQKLTFTDPKTVAAVSEMARLGKAGTFANLTAPQAVQEFGQGKLAMVINSSSQQSALLAAVKGHYQMLDAQLPSFSPTQPSVPINSGSALAITVKAPLDQRAAWELIKYLTSDQAYTQITENIGYAPLRTSLVKDPKYLKNWSLTQSLTAVNLRQLAHVSPWQDYPGPNFAQVEVVLENAVTSAVFQGANPTSALASAQAQAQSLLH